MILKYYLKGKEKVYTLKENHEDNLTQEAHYKFIKFTQDPNKEAQQ